MDVDLEQAVERYSPEAQMRARAELQRRYPTRGNGAWNRRVRALNTCALWVLIIAAWVLTATLVLAVWRAR